MYSFFLPYFGLNSLWFQSSGGDTVVFVLFRLALSVGILVSLHSALFLESSERLVTRSGPLEL